MIILLKVLVGFNTISLRLGRQLATIAIGLMVIIILIQVFFRYGLNSALPWPDEAARFLMLWMTGLIAPSAYRWGGFVSIEMLFRFLPSKMVKIITLILLVISLLVLVVGLQFGLKHVDSGWLFFLFLIEMAFASDWYGNYPGKACLDVHVTSRRANNDVPSER